MRRLRSPWRVHRPSTGGPLRRRLLPAAQLDLARSESSFPPKPKPKPFELSPLILDLDAEDSPFVRAYTALDEAHQVAKWARRPPPHRPSRPLLERQQQQQQQHAAAATPYSPWRVSDADVATVALLGRADTPELAALLAALGAPPGAARDAPVAMAYLRHAQRRSRAGPDDTTMGTERGGWARPRGARSAGGYEHLAEAMRSFPPPTLGEIRRVVAAATTTAAGYRAVAGAGADIARAVERTRALLDDDGGGGGGSGAREVVGMVGNAAFALGGAGVPLGEPLCGLGLEAAARARSEPAVRTFLALGWCEGWYRPGAEGYALGGIEKVLALFLRELNAGGAAAEETLLGAPATVTVRATLFGLLTGADFVGPPPVLGPQSTSAAAAAAEAAPLPSFRATLGQDVTRSYVFYLHLLGELGAVRTLWHEWRAFDGLKIRNTTTTDTTTTGADGEAQSQQPAPPPPAFKDNLFASAMVLAAPSLLRTRAETEPEAAAAALQATGQYAADAVLDLRAILARENTPTTAARHTGGGAGGDGLLARMIDPSFHAALRDRVVRALAKDDVAEAMAALQAVLGRVHGEMDV